MPQCSRHGNLLAATARCSSHTVKEGAASAPQLRLSLQPARGCHAHATRTRFTSCSYQLFAPGHCIWFP